MKLHLISRECPNVCNNFFVNAFVNYVRTNNYPHMETEVLRFKGVKDYALCSELNVNQFAEFIWSMKEGLANGEKDVFAFEGGMYDLSGEEFNIYVDGHLYFFDF